MEAHDNEWMSFGEMKFGSGKRNAPNGVFVDKSRLVSDQIGLGEIGKTRLLTDCPLRPRADLSFFREARLGTYRAEAGLGELEPIDNHHQQAC